MSELLSPDAPRRLLSELCRLAAERAAAEQSLRAEFDARNEAAEKEFQDAERSLTAHYIARKAAVEAEYASKHDTTAAKLQAEHDALQKEYETAKAKAIARFTADQEAAQQALQDAHWEATEAADAARGGLNLPLKELLAALDARWQQLETIHHDAVELMERRGHWRDLPELPPVGVILEKQPGRRFCHAVEQSQVQFRVLSKQLLPRFFQGLRPLGIFLLLWLLAAGPLLGLFKVFDWWNWWHWAAAASGVAVVVGLVAGIWTSRIAKRKSVEAYLALRRTMLEAGLGYPNVLETTKAECQRLDATIIARHKAQSQKADETFAAATARIERRQKKELQEADDALSPAAGRTGRAPRPDAQGDRGQRPSAAPPDRRTVRRRVAANPPAARAGSGGKPAAIRPRVERHGQSLVVGHRALPLVGHRSRPGLPRGVSPLEHRRLEPLVAAVGHPAGGGSSAAAR